MSRRRRRNPFGIDDIIFWPLLLSAAGGVTYFATRPKTVPAVGVPPVGGSAGAPILLQHGASYMLSGPGDDLPSTPLEFAQQLTSSGQWTNVAVVYFNGQGAIPTYITAPQGGYVYMGTWLGPNQMLSGGDTTAIPWDLSQSSGAPTLAFDYAGSADTAGAGDGGGATPSGGGGGGGSSPLDQAKGAVSTAENDGNSLEDQYNQLTGNNDDGGGGSDSGDGS